MLKRILIIWAIANFATVGLVSWMAGGGYMGWHVAPVTGMLAELGLIMVPNLILPILVLRYLIFPRFCGQGVKRSSLLWCESVRTPRG